MKKLFLLMVFSAAAAALCAEDMQFVTVLSNPVGTFKEVQALSDDEAAVSVKQFTIGVNAARPVTITVNGFSANALKTANEGTLTDNGSSFKVNAENMEFKKARTGEFTAGTLKANTVSTKKILVKDELKLKGNVGIGTSARPGAESAGFGTMKIQNTALLETKAAGTTKATKLNWEKCGDFFMLASGELNCGSTNPPNSNPPPGDSGSGGSGTSGYHWQVNGTYRMGSVPVSCGDVPNCQDGSPQAREWAKEAAKRKCANMVGNRDPTFCKSAVGVSCNPGRQATCIVKDSYSVGVQSGSGFAGSSTYDCFAKQLVCKS